MDSSLTSIVAHKHHKIGSSSDSKRIILDSYDYLINQVDIFAETVLNKHSESELLDSCMWQKPKIQNERKPEKQAKFDMLEENDYIDPYKEKYQTDEKLKTPALLDPNTTKVHDYINKMRQEIIDELVKLQGDTLKEYEMNKDKIVIDETKSVEQRQDLDEKLFGNKNCFILESKTTTYLFVFNFYIDAIMRKKLQ